MNNLLQQQDFKALFDSTLDAIMVADDDGVYLAANPAACELLKAPESFILGRTVADFIPPERHELSRQRWQNFLREGQVSGEIALICHDGSHCIAEYRAKANFRPGQHLSVLRDVTERRRTEDALVESNRQIVSIMESVSDAVLAFDKEWRFLYANPQSEPILGRPRQELIGKNLWEEYPETKGTAFEEGYLQAARQGTPVHFQGFIPDTWLEVNVYPSAVGVTVYLRDINDRRRAEENLSFLAEAGAVLSSSLDHDLIIQNLAELAISYIADWCAIDILEEGQLKRLSVVHKDPAKIEFAHSFQKRYPPNLDGLTGVPQVLRSGESQLWEDISDDLLVASAKDPDHLEMIRQLGMRSVIFVPLVARGQTIGAMTLVREKSGRRYSRTDLLIAEEFGRRAGGAVENGRLFRDMTNALRTAQDASRARDEFLAIVSHELKTPMTPILGWIGLLKSEGNKPDSDTLQHAMDVIERNAKAQSQLVNDLLDISRIVTGKLQLNIQQVDLAAVVRFAVETLRPAAQAKAIELLLRLEDPVELLQADADRIQQVVWNLLSNAIKFTPRSGLVAVSLRHIDSTIEFTVRDTGQGIERSFLPYLFDRFRQADSSSTREHGGLGLGLSIVRNLVELHGGTVSAESDGPGLGATFTVRLPRQMATSQLSQVTEQNATGKERSTNGASPQTGPGAELNGLSILVIEDMQDSRDLVVTLLQRKGAEVKGAASAREGFALLQEWHPDVVLCDIGMPEEDGYSFIKRVRALPAEQGGNTAAIALTAYGRTEDRLLALESGFQQHVVKPATSAELAIIIASVTGRQKP